MSRAILAFITLTLAACYTEPKVVMTADKGMRLPCTGLEPSCRKMDIRISIDKDPDTKLSREDKRHKQFVVFGRCELVVENPDHPPTSYPCTELRVSLSKKNTGEERNTWLQGTTFEIRDLTRGPYTFNAYSDQYMTGTRVDKIIPGQPLKIEIRICPPSVKTATEI